MSKSFIKKNIENLSARYGTHQVFSDFIICCAYAISNKFNFDQEKEDEYLKIAKKYKKEEMNKFGEMLGCLFIEFMNEEPKDVLGELYEELQLASKKNGQFFTPKGICDFMSAINIDKNYVKDSIREDGYFSINDPACGSGRLLISSLKRLQNEQINIDDVCFSGEDVSLLCACMTYINLSLLGASGIVRHKNTLTNETYSVFYTPCFVMNKELQNKMKQNIEKEIENE